MKKAVSQLISYIMLIGMVVAMSVVVATYLINQAKTSANFDAKEIEAQCTDVSIDALPLCEKSFPTDPTGNIKILELNMTNRPGSYYNITNLTVVRKYPSEVKTLSSEEFGYFLYKDNGEFYLDTNNPPKPLQIPIRPGKKAQLQVVFDTTKTTELTITPWVGFNENNVPCNEKIFKLTVPSGISSC